MLDLILYYAAESSYLRILVISLIPILIAPIAILYLARSLFLRFDPKGNMTPTRLILFVALVAIMTLGLMALVLWFYLPPNTDFRLTMIIILVVFGLLGAGRLHLFEGDD